MPDSRLILQFGADTAGAKRALTELAQSIAVNMASVSTSAAHASQALGLVSRGISTILSLPWARFAVGVTAGLAAVSALSAAIRGTRDELREMLDIGQKAREANVSPEFFQAFTRGIGKLKSESEEFERALTHAFKATKETLDEVNPVLQRLEEFQLAGLTPTRLGLDLYRAAQTQDERIRAVLVAMQELERAGERLAALDLAERMFGREFTDRLRRGERTIDEILGRLDAARQRAATGAEFISDENVRRARELDERLQAAYETIERNLKPSWEALASIALGIKGIWADIVGLVARATASWSADAALQRALAERERILKELDTGQAPDTGFGGALPGGTRGARRRNLESRLRELNEQLAQYDAQQLRNVTGAPPPSDQVPLPRPAPLPKVEDTAKRLDAVERYIERLEQLTDELRLELVLEGASTQEREKQLAVLRATAEAKREGRDLTAEERQRVAELGAEYGRLKSALDDVRQKQQAVADAFRQMGDMAVEAFADMKLDANDLRRILDQLWRTLLQAIFTGQGWLAPLLGLAAPASGGSNAVGGLAGLIMGALGLGGGGGAPTVVTGLGAGTGGLPFIMYGGPRQHGGRVTPGRWYTVGEAGPERFVPDQSGTIYPLRRAAGDVINIRFSVEAADAPSFRRSQNAIETMLARAVARARRSM